MASRATGWRPVSIPTDKGFYHGGDIDGLVSQLDYIEGLGTTAIWLTPAFKNRPVQGVEPDISAGYHGYWITDFTQIDPHLGTNDDLRTLVDEAHARGIKVFFDIITNHTADVIGYAGGHVHLHRQGDRAVSRPRPAFRSTTVTTRGPRRSRRSIPPCRSPTRRSTARSRTRR